MNIFRKAARATGIAGIATAAILALTAGTAGADDSPGGSRLGNRYFHSYEECVATGDGAAQRNDLVGFRCDEVAPGVWYLEVW